MYFGGVSIVFQEEILELTGWTKGDLLFKYFGVPPLH